MRVVIADDTAILRQGLARLLTEAGSTVVAEAGDGEHLLSMVRELRPDVAIVDVRMPPTYTDEGLRAALTIRREHPRTAVLVLSQYVETDIPAAIAADNPRGFGYLLKDRVADIDELVSAMHRVARGESAIDPLVVAQLLHRRRPASPLDQLTERERTVLALMAEGRTNESIAQHLYLGAKTVETHVRNIFSKLGLEPSHTDHRRVLAVLTYLRS
jgi:serine/threonine-protein kinase